MVIEENEKANYLAHFKTKGAKNGIRRFQSYMVAPNPSGATGVEIGEAAEQRARMHGDSDDNQQQTYKSAKELRKEARRQKKLQKIAAKRKKKEQGDKEKWAKSYRELRKHSDAFTNEELRRAIERLELEDRITGASLNSVRDKTQKGADILKNLDSAGRSMAGIYNTVAGGLNAYHTITGKGKKLPTIGRGNESIQVKKPNSNNNNRNNRNNQNNNSQRTDNNRNQDNNSQRTNSSDNQDNKSQQHQNGHGHYSYKDEHTDELRENARRYSYDMNQFNKQYSKDHPELPRNWKTNNLQPYPEGLSSVSGSDLSYLRKRLKDKMILHDALDRISEHLEHHGVKGQSWFTRHFQSYKTAPTRSGKVGVEVGMAAKQADRNGEEDTSGKPKNLDSYGLKGYNRNTSSFSFGTYTDYRKDRNDKDGMFVRTTIDEEDDGSVNKKSIDLMKHVEDNWDEIKKDVLNTYKKEIVDLYEAYDNMSHEDAVKAAEKAFSNPKNTDMSLRPIGDWDTIDIGIYNQELGWGDHLLSMEYDPYKKKKIGAGLGFDG